MKTIISRSILAAFVLVAGGVGAAHAQSEVDIGKREFEDNCAVCHGVDGKGNGPMASFTTQKVPDVTQIQKSNNGVFPFARLYGVIDGTEEQWVKSHGARDMPVWGREYSRNAEHWLGYYYGPADVESFVRGRILALLGYIHTLQE